MFNIEDVLVMIWLTWHVPVSVSSCYKLDAPKLSRSKPFETLQSTLTTGDDARGYSWTSIRISIFVARLQEVADSQVFALKVVPKNSRLTGVFKNDIIEASEVIWIILHSIVVGGVGGEYESSPLKRARLRGQLGLQSQYMQQKYRWQKIPGQRERGRVFTLADSRHPHPMAIHFWGMCGSFRSGMGRWQHWHWTWGEQT